MTWIDELARLAAEAKTVQDPDWYWPSWTEDKAYIAACTPERIAALVRVAQAAQELPAFARSASLANVLRWMETTP